MLLYLSTSTAANLSLHNIILLALFNKHTSHRGLVNYIQRYVYDVTGTNQSLFFII